MRPVSTRTPRRLRPAPLLGAVAADQAARLAAGSRHTWTCSPTTCASPPTSAAVARRGPLATSTCPRSEHPAASQPRLLGGAGRWTGTRGSAAYVRDVFDSDDVLSMLRTVQSIVTHLENFPASAPSPLAAAPTTSATTPMAASRTSCARVWTCSRCPARHLPVALVHPRFARAVTELLHLTKEDIDELH